jgi:acyl carrier protein
VMRLAAYLTAKPGAELATARLRAALEKALPEFMVPSQITVLETMPLTPNGKIDRAALLSSREATVSVDEAAYAPPQDALELSIAAIWQDALNLRRIGRTDSFFALGGDSLLAVAVHRRLCDALRVDLPITDIFLCPTIARLAQQIRSAGELGAPPPLIKRVSREAYRVG